MTNDNIIPAFLKGRGRKFYEDVLSEFIIETFHDRERLAAAAGELDIQDEAQKAIDTHGFYVVNRYGRLIENPGIKTLRDSRTLFVRILRELQLDVSAEESRPPSLYGGSHAQKTR